MARVHLKDKYYPERIWQCKGIRQPHMIIGKKIYINEDYEVLSLLFRYIKRSQSVTTW